MSDTFYAETLRRLKKAGRLHETMSILVVCGTHVDRDVFFNEGFKDVTISNINESHGDDRIAPYRWMRQDVEALSVEDAAYDWLVVHHGLHHCRRPHNALLEMYRAARVGILVCEPRDNVLVRIGKGLGVGQEYEVHAVADNEQVGGGVNDSAIPNFVYRWRPREIIDCLKAYSPEFEIEHTLYHHLEVHWHDLKVKRNKIPWCIALLSWPLLRVGVACIPSLANTFALAVYKTNRTHPWLKQTDRGVLPDNEWFRQRIQKRI